MHRFILCLGMIALMSSSWASSCPSGTGDFICAGNVYHCVPSGSTCCSTATPSVCTPSQSCLLCNSRFSCVARGSTCCFELGFCGPEADCRVCASNHTCVLHGHGCPRQSGRLDFFTRFEQSERALLLWREPQ